MISGLRAVVAGAMASLLSACVSGSPPTGDGRQAIHPDAPRAPTAGDGIPSLPSDYKKIAAKHVLLGFMDNAIGPPEISEIQTHKAPLGATSKVIIRYPVSVETAAKTNFTARAGAGTYYRCGGASAFASISTFGATNFSTGMARVATNDCNPSLKYSRYRELEDLAANCRDQPKTCGVIRTPLGGALIDGKTIVYD